MCPSASRARAGGPRLDSENGLAEQLAAEHRRKGLPGVGQRQRGVDHRLQLLLDAEAHQALELVPCAHRRADDRQLQEENTREVGPPGLSARTECAQVAWPVVSITASTRSGSRAPGSNACSAPSCSARARFSSERPVTQTRTPAALPSTVSAVATPPVAPWTRIVCPGTTPPRVNSIR